MPSSVRFLTVRMFSLLLLLFFHLRACHSSPSMHPLCHDEESHALLQFKQSLAINESASSDPSAYPKVESWKVDGESRDCCSWDGVECDRDSGHVICLDLSSSFLYGSIDSNSTLFHLVHLRRLNLADNDFKNSEIPSEIRNLPRLFDLNLSFSGFSGQIPAEILELSKLVSIDLGLNSLKLQKLGLQHLVEALTNLQVLHLSGVDISAKVPQIMANLSSLSSLFLSDCELQGEFPLGIFQLPNLRFLRIRFNPYLTGYLPEFQSGSQLETLLLEGTNFSGQLPESIGNLKSLKEFCAAECYFSGAIPSSLGNLAKLNSLDLSNNSFSGKIPSTFVNLLQLTYLSLSYNNLSSGTLHWLCNLTKLNFIDLSLTNSYGEIPSCLGNLTQLAVLQLTQNKLAGQIPSCLGNLTQLAVFSGQMPAEILELSKLVSIDLGWNSLKLQKPGLQHLVEALTNLEVLHLGGVNISAKVPQIMANLSSLTSLFLRDCGLQGEFPLGIFQLPNLRFLSIQSNPYLTGYLPEFHQGSRLETLKLTETNFSGQLPESIGNLKSLKEFDVSGCYFSGAIPSSLGNLTKLNSLDLSNNSFSGKIPSTFVNLLQLTYLSLSSNNFSSGTLHWLCNLTKLNSIDLSLTNSYGEIPSCLGNLTQLAVLMLDQNKLAGQIPSWIGNHTLFISLTLVSNGLHGPIPESIFRLPNLEILDLQENLFRGTVNVGLLRSRSLVNFQLNGNNLSVICNSNDSVALPKFQVLGLVGCNLSGEFPRFLHGQNHLESLDLAENNIEGHIPKWFMNLGNLRYLRLSGNKLEGALPIPPRSTIIYQVSDNRLTGEIPPAICNLTSLVVLQLSNNNLNSKLPQCLGNISNSVSVLDLRNNSFSGEIPNAFSSGCTLRAIDFSQNQLEGKIPRSLANCTELKILNIEENKINDVFPSWLGIFPKLRVLILRSNRLHGVIGKPRANFEFQRLQIVDLSGNCFLGKLPLEYFRNWTAMKTIYKEHPLYMEVALSLHGLTYHFVYSMTMTNKGVLTYYGKIQEFLTAIDLSSNCFEGRIPDALGDLKELYLLNLSNNLLTGRIPPSLSNLKELEALDLSQNKLSGEIPVQLAQLTFLAVFNVSHNVLSGPIPRGNQFDTFDKTSFDANPGLCGKPLSRKCGNGEDSLPAAKRDEGSTTYPLEFGWKVVVIGYASGLVLGVILGCVMDTRKYEWLVKNYFARWQR